MRGELLKIGWDLEEISLTDFLDFVYALALEPPGGLVDPFEYRQVMIDMFAGNPLPAPKANPVPSSKGRRGGVTPRPQRQSDISRAIRELEEMRARQAERSQDKPGPKKPKS